MKKSLFFVLCSLFIAFVSDSANAEFDTNARSAYLIDPASNAAIVDKDSDELMPPSSMLKMMTLAVVFDAIQAGNLKMTDQMSVSQNADYKNPNWKTASKICLESGQKISVSDAIMGTIVMSGGDAAVVLAEKLGGSESNFTAMMLKRARAIGMPKSTFGNATGLPSPDNLMTSRELATLAEYLITAHADLYPLFATRRFEFGGYRNEWCTTWGAQHTTNYNKLLFIMPGADGLKTGHTDTGGYGMTASAVRGGRRLIGVLNGMKARDHNALAREMKRLLDYGFDNTTTRVFFKPGDAIVRVPLWYGRQRDVAATVARPFAITTMNGANTSGLRILARYDEPAIAPVRPGDKIGEIVAEMNGQIVSRGALVAKDKVGRTIFIGRIWQNLKIIFGMK